MLFMMILVSRLFVPLRHQSFATLPMPTLYRGYIGNKSSQPDSTEPRYQVDGKPMTRAEVEKIDPLERSISAWRVLVDWDLKKIRPYVMVDPYDPSGLLYLPYHEYVVTMRTLAAAKVQVVIVCRPDTAQPVPLNSSSSNHPPLYKIRGTILDSDINIPSWRQFTSLREWIRRNVDVTGAECTVKVHDGNIHALVNLWGRELLHYLAVKSPGTKVEGLMPLADHLQTLLRHCGVKFTISRLKIYLYVLNSFIGGTPVATTDPFKIRVRLSNGLPAFLPKAVRDSLRANNLDAVRLWASLFGIYKALEGPHGLSSLNTIGAPPLEGADAILGEFKSFVDSQFLSSLPLRKGAKLPQWKYQSGLGTVISSAGANGAHAMCSILLDAAAWSLERVNHTVELAKLFGDQKLVKLMKVMANQGRFLVALGHVREGLRSGTVGTPKWIAYTCGLYKTKGFTLEPQSPGMSNSLRSYSNERILRALNVHPDPLVRAFDDGAKLRLLEHFAPSGELEQKRRAVNLKSIRWDTLKGAITSPVLGRLHAINEAAGKVRVVAICDYWTQVLCKPIHEFLFSVLKLLTTDGTFDQQGAVDSFAKEGYTDIICYDLTAATDMIPLQLYQIVVGRFIGEQLAQKWVSLLSDRLFLKPRDHLKAIAEGSLPKETSTKIKYSRGQPMGALSSWAGLAIVHHALILFAGYRAGIERTAMLAYRVLGDDVLFGNLALANAYRDVCKLFGIPIGDYKSYKSNKGLMNFASQTLLGTENISPVSFKEVLSATTWARRLEVARRIMHRYGSKGQSLLRLSVTAPMWGHLTAELSGVKATHFVRLVRFILANPFLVPKDQIITIDSLLSWAGEISPMLKSVSKTEASHLEDLLKKALVAAIGKQWSVMWYGTSKSHGYDKGLKLKSPYSEYGAGQEIHYLFQCYQEQAKRFYRKALREYGSVFNTLQRGGGAAISLGVSHLTLTQLVQVLIYLKSVPKAVWFVKPNGGNSFPLLERVLLDSIGKTNPDDESGVSSGSKPRTEVLPQESLRGPVLELTVILARTFGLFVPAAEIVGLSFSSRWWRHISAALEYHYRIRGTIDQSPVFGEVALVPWTGPPPLACARLEQSSMALVPWTGNRSREGLIDTGAPHPGVGF
jgi:hypothetical protein